jgi:hypothetical protein
MLNVAPRHADSDREHYFFGRWVEDEWGATGRRYCEGRDLLAVGFDAAQAAFGPGIVDWLSARH